MALTFKAIQLVVVALFVFVISDHRRQTVATPIIDQRLLRFTKACYPIPIAVWIWTVVMAGDLIILDWIALILSVMGTTVTSFAKAHLGKAHVWAGYYRNDTHRVSTGFYRFIAHPMYAGIVGVMVAGSLFMVTRLSVPVFVIVVSVQCWIVCFLVVVARRETALWLRGQDEVPEPALQGTEIESARLGQRPASLIPE